MKSKRYLRFGRHILLLCVRQRQGSSCKNKSWLLQLGVSLDYFIVYSLAGKVFGAIPVLFALYTLFTAVLPPVICRVYRKKAG